ncbi:MAG: M67 family metallopeptidase [Gammaproteobacteria bacterium]|jgi:proteasome lid subunit RPN8/RPN11|nr:M67 family metallopeptidase [Gammaproteobacteria bacterium]MBT4607078.1 M67 family metallopeptidase [Thiotrichales bacterium]MBT3472394.1 M67 family metallopeptidase [Gammaproteobacteria bacterium]MBT3968524.1 M67 family metallopeptidase [Gammaproteobacteria bacterium]MBT4079042.1 M67 family metallopeptidase [Gammaproteobacteria bacterium]
MSEFLPRSLAVKLLAEAQQHPQQEVCGLISSHNGVANQLFPIENIANRPERLFEMEPQQQIEAMRQIREQGSSLWAIYHSHPDAPAAPSAKDLADASYADALYLVISMNTEGVLEMRGFRLQSDIFNEVALETSDY